MDIIKLNQLTPEEVATMRADVARAVSVLDAYHTPPKNAVYLYPNAKRLQLITQQIEQRGRRWLRPSLLPSPLAFDLWLVFGSFYGDNHAVKFTAYRDERLQIVGCVVMAADFLTGESMERANDYYLLLEIVARKRGFRVR